MMVTIDKAGRVVIPKDLRDQLDLGVNTELEVTVEGDSLRLTRPRAQGRAIVEVDGWPVIAPVPGFTITDADVQQWRDDVRR
ncbi:MAG: AbrB/MazE/SpoVT family DNA-binding domain-containing protein [Mobilicoccus sp.]|nr:AbrB/MazE/SpoVT family DNA-binding domain-containing protein [Mobilicoccus sp.]